jgi:hypothetical protein
MFMAHNICIMLRAICIGYVSVRNRMRALRSYGLSSIPGRGRIFYLDSTSITQLSRKGKGVSQEQRNRSERLTLSNPFFSAKPYTSQLLFVLGGKEVGGLLVIILQF